MPCATPGSTWPCWLTTIAATAVLPGCVRPSRNWGAAASCIPACFTDSLDRAANNPLWVERYGVRFALLNYTYGTNGIPVPAGVEVNLIDTARMAADLAAARRGAPDCVAVCIHWGNEYERRENAVQRHLAQFLRRHGADLVVGSHPHVVQPFDADSSHVVLYSLGNFVVQPAAALLRRRVGGRNRGRAASRRAHVLFA